jgi:hypothetical protein
MGTRAWPWWVLGMLWLGSVGGCGARELAWLVPRASVGFAVRTHEGHVAGAGFVTLTTPLERPGRAFRPASASAPLRLLGGPMPCRVQEACRWEARARAGTLADLVEEEALETRGAP